MPVQFPPLPLETQPPISLKRLHRTRPYTIAMEIVCICAIFSSAVAQQFVTSASLGSWSTSSLSSPRTALAATSLPNVGVAMFAGGEVTAVYSNVVDVYNLTSGTWGTAALSLARKDVSAVSLQNFGVAIFAGGWIGVPSNVVDIFNATSGSWSTAVLSSARSYLSAAALPDLALFAGGWATSGPPDVVDMFNVTSRSWSTALLSVPRTALAATSLPNFNVAMFAGGASPSGYSNVVDIFDAAAGRWSTAALSVARRDIAATSLPNLGVAVFAGGNSGSDSQVVDTIAPPIVVASIAISANGAASQVAVILAFTPIKSMPANGNGTITLGMPSGYFIGTAFFAAGSSSVASLTGSATAASVSTSTQIVIKMAGAAYGPAKVTLTLSGLALGTAQAAGIFELYTSAQNGTSRKIAMVAPAILKAASFASISVSSNGAKTPDVSFVIVFASDMASPIGTITLNMPSDYVAGAPTVISNVSSLSATAATNTTAIIITTAGTIPTNSFLTMTLSGLTLGQPQAAGMFHLSTSAEPGTQQKPAPAIIALAVVSSNVTVSTVTSAYERTKLSFRINFIMPSSYFPGSSSLLEPFSSQASNSTDGTQVTVVIGGISWITSSISSAYVPAITPQVSQLILDELLMEYRRGTSAICSVFMRGLISAGQMFSSFECIRPLSIQTAVVR